MAKNILNFLQIHHYACFRDGWWRGVEEKPLIGHVGFGRSVNRMDLPQSRHEHAAEISELRVVRAELILKGSPRDELPVPFRYTVEPLR